MNLIKNKNIYYPELSYEIAGLLFKVHNSIGRFKSERQYCDVFEELLKENKIIYSREIELKKLFDNIIENGNIPDFIIEDKIIIDFKVKKFITKEDYYQMLRYLETVNFPLGLIVNFRSTYLKPKRVINSKYHSNNSSVNS
jgi:GxxExxY protein